MSVSNSGKRKRTNALDDGEKRHRSLLALQRAELLNYPEKGRRKRTPVEQWAEYEKQGGKRTSRSLETTCSKPEPRFVKLVFKFTWE
jgi:hypothetical protein